MMDATKVEIGAAATTGPLYGGVGAMRTIAAHGSSMGMFKFKRDCEKEGRFGEGFFCDP